MFKKLNEVLIAIFQNIHYTWFPSLGQGFTYTYKSKFVEPKYSRYPKPIILIISLTALFYTGTTLTDILIILVSIVIGIPLITIIGHLLDHYTYTVYNRNNDEGYRSKLFNFYLNKVLSGKIETFYEAAVIPESIFLENPFKYVNKKCLIFSEGLSFPDELIVKVNVPRNYPVEDNQTFHKLIRIGDTTYSDEDLSIIIQKDHSMTLGTFKEKNDSYISADAHILKENVLLKKHVIFGDLGDKKYFPDMRRFYKHYIIHDVLKLSSLVMQGYRNFCYTLSKLNFLKRFDPEQIENSNKDSDSNEDLEKDVDPFMQKLIDTPFNKEAANKSIEDYAEYHQTTLNFASYKHYIEHFLSDHPIYDELASDLDDFKRNGVPSERLRSVYELIEGVSHYQVIKNIEK